MTGQIEERVDLGDRHSLGPIGDLHDRIAAAELALLDDATVEARAPAAGEERSHARLVHADTEAVAGDPRLRDLEDGGADPEAVADARLVVREPVDGEVLAELT